MGFRFRKNIKILPGIRINLSKSGVSTSIGKPGATINISERGTRGTVGIPGTGISYSEKLSSHKSDVPSNGMGFGALLGWGLVALFVGILIFGLVTS
ncbi:DUF4236 domain-containing protein [Polaromonas sp. C04]|uniref:DUF4236 domain-containing protein n=1 Tax=Polaromonas sp. C04 TaxID=1945857 RepID=UPI000985F3B4|nr:DUF4236 domain-containing protein [Polaromonas sp. C04]OOG58075.1 hypothetical protein B0E49_04405 [Polaromonas sp. C04]